MCSGKVCMLGHFETGKPALTTSYILSSCGGEGSVGNAPLWD